MEEQVNMTDLKQETDMISITDLSGSLSQLGRISFDELIAEIRF